MNYYSIKMKINLKIIKSKAFRHFKLKQNNKSMFNLLMLIKNEEKVRMKLLT